MSGVFYAATYVTETNTLENSLIIHFINDESLSVVCSQETKNYHVKVIRYLGSYTKKIWSK